MNELDTLRIKRRNVEVDIKNLKDKLHILEEEKRDLEKRIVAKVDMGKATGFRTSIS